ncbi:SKP1-like protein 1 [Corylus avellana]|uniref:SKP1-like protein 1 n=1 Tax=Corylus avellana TaxID=13451 RepID=UPI001E1FCFC7|nr:SKP1-like protein 1 [Corylus avellana]
MSSSKKSRIVKLKSSDDKTFEVEEAVAVQFETIKSMIDYACANDCTIPLPNVNAKTLAMVVEWCKKHADKHGQLMEVDVDEAPVAVLYDLLVAATYLRVEGLIHRVSQRISEMMIDIGKQPEEEEDLRKIINIKSDFPPQVEEELRKLRRMLGPLSDVLVFFVSSGLLQ